MTCRGSHLFLSPERRGKVSLGHRKTASVDKTIADVLSDYLESRCLLEPLLGIPVRERDLSGAFFQPSVPSPSTYAAA